MEVGNCEYWISNVEADSNATAAKECAKVLNGTAVLAMPNKEKIQRELSSQITRQHFIGGYFKKSKSFWNDGTSLKSVFA